MTLLQILARIARMPEEKREVEEMQAAEQAAKDAVERPPYTPEEEREIRLLWSEPIVEKEIEELTITSHIEHFIYTCSKEQLTSFAYFLLKYGFDLPNERAMELAAIVAQNPLFLKGGFYNINIRRPIIEILAAKKNGPERNVTAAVLSNPKKFTDVFNVYYRRPPSGIPLMTVVEWERGHQPPKRRD